VSKRKPEETPVQEVVEVVEAGDGVADLRVEAIRERAQRQLRAGRLSRLNDRIAGGPRRPGEQEVARSPFVLGMGFVLLGLAIVAAVLFFLNLGEGEKRQLENASAALEKSSYNEAIKLFEAFLLDYPNGESAETAKIGLHTAQVRKYTDDNEFSVEEAVAAQKSLEEFIRECRDFDGFKNEQENRVRYAKKISRLAATVAVKQSSQDALDAGKAAFKRLESLTADGGLSAELREELLHLQNLAAAAILKKGRLGSTKAEIRAALEKNDTLGAVSKYQELIDRFEVLKDDADFREVLGEIIQKEMGLIVIQDVGVEGFTSEADIDQRPSLSLNLRTQATADQVSQDKLVFGAGGGVVYALDSATGDPVWKIGIGGRAPFAPIQVDAASPALLVFHSERNELMLVHQANGSLIWRQSIESAASGPPLILNQQIYITTETGELWQVSMATGRAVKRVKFNQPVQGPPTVSRDGESLIIPGLTAFVYTLSRQSLECRAASWLGYGEGAVKAPVITMGDLFLLCDNYSSERSYLRALELSDNGELVERERQKVNGQVHDPCLLRGDQLFVPSTPQRVTAFRVSDRPNNDALALAMIGTNQLPEAVFSSMFLVAGPGGNLWMASTALRRFQVTTQAVLLHEPVVAEGQHLYPMQIDDDSLLVSTNEPYSASVFFTRVNRDTMTGIWRTVLSTNLVAAGPSTSGKSLIAVSDFGEVFRIPVDALDQSSFYTKSVSRFRLPDGLKDPVSGLELPDGRLAAWCGGKEPAVWTVNSSGQLEQRWPLSAVPEASPVPLAGGLVVPMPGRLTLTATRQQVADYQVSRDLNAQASWKSLTPVNDTQLVAINSDDQLVQIEYRKTPRPHLAEVSVTTLAGKANVAPVAGGDYLCIATVDGRLLLMRSASLEIVREVDLEGVASQRLRVAGDRLFVEIGDDQVQVFELNDSFASAGTFQKNGARLIDAPLPLSSGGFLAAFFDGTIRRLDPRGLPVGEATQLGQQLRQGPIAIGDNVVVLAIDGSLYVLNDLVRD
jgi:hypothetical protein